MPLICTTDEHTALGLVRGGNLPVLLFGPRRPGVASVGNPLRATLRRLVGRPSQEALDLLSVALAVTAADRFVVREDALDSWTRDLDVTIPVHDVVKWQFAAAPLVDMLQFLTGDRWTVRFQGGGYRVGQLLDGRIVRSHHRQPSGDCLCLFSGGMDSYLGAADLVAQGNHPVLVSQYQPGEKTPQRTLRTALGTAAQDHVALNPSPRNANGPMDPHQRSRSFLFIAMAVVVGSAARLTPGADGSIDLHVPENGFIALNAPLTLSRAGTLSTRTVHPVVVQLMQAVLSAAGVPFRIRNMFADRTKGEMLATFQASGHPGVPLLRQTISCGAYRRNNYRQCGYCVPCLIRRAAFHHAGLPDLTGYKEPAPVSRPLGDPDLGHVAAFDAALRNPALLVSHLRLGLARLSPGQWPALEQVCARGLAEVGNVLRTL